MSYYQFKDEEEREYGSFEVFYADDCDVGGEFLPAGFYWWACFPGCLPDGEPCGPYGTEEEAVQDANDV